MMAGLNIMPQYNDYFHLTTATQSLQIATIYVGGCIACLFWGWLTDAYGRRPSLFWAAAVTVLAAALQASSRSVAMFCAARVLVGLGTTASAISAPAYLAEVLPWDQRAMGLALFDDLFYVGALAAAAVTYGSARIEGDWAWRLPSLLQGLWGLLCVALLPFMPESPRWLVDVGRHEEALRVLACVNAGGDVGDDLVRLQFVEICDTIGYERDPLPWRRMLRERGPRRRLVIAATCALFSMVQGNLLVQYQIGKMLDHAGVTDKTTQLVINMGTNGVSLVVSFVGTFFTARIGAKTAALASTAAITVVLVVIGLLTRSYGESSHKPGIYATVAMIFVAAASFAFGWIPILFLVPAEVLNFSIRAVGMSLFSMVVCLTGIWGNFAFLFGLESIGWRFYMINAAWNVAVFLFIAWYWVELKGKTLEEVDVLFDGVKHSDVPGVEVVLSGRADGSWRDNVAKRFVTRLPMISRGSRPLSAQA